MCIAQYSVPVLTIALAFSLRVPIFLLFCSPEAVCFQEIKITRAGLGEILSVVRCMVFKLAASVV